MVRLRKKNLIENEKEILSLNPKSLVSHFYEKIDVTTAGIVLFVAIFLESLIFLFLKMPNILEYFTIKLITNFVVTWIILGFVLYLLLYLIKGKSNLKGGEYKKILSGLVSFRVVSIFAILIMLLIFMIFMPNIFPILTMLLNNPNFLLETGLLPAIGIWGGIGIFLSVIFMILIVVYYLTMLYNFVKKMYEFEGFFPNFIMMIIILIIMGFLSSLI